MAFRSESAPVTYVSTAETKSKAKPEEKTQDQKDIEFLAHIQMSKLMYAEKMKEYSKNRPKKNQGLVFWQ